MFEVQRLYSLIIINPDHLNKSKRYYFLIQLSHIIMHHHSIRLTPLLVHYYWFIYNSRWQAFDHTLPILRKTKICRGFWGGQFTKNQSFDKLHVYYGLETFNIVWIFEFVWEHGSPYVIAPLTHIISEMRTIIDYKFPKIKITFSSNDSKTEQDLIHEGSMYPVA